MTEPDEEFKEAKRRVSRKFLGTAGVHGVGVREEGRKIAVFRQSSPGEGDEEREAVIAEIKKEAGPFEVEVVEDEPPEFTSAPTAEPAQTGEEHANPASAVPSQPESDSEAARPAGLIARCTRWIRSRLAR